MGAIRVFWRSEPPRLPGDGRSVLPYGKGRSYGDSCLNDGGWLLDTAALDRFIAFDEAGGSLRCEAGVSLAEILRLIVPRGWFLPVVPGTKHVTIGGAIANDIHGKNHHRAGSFGCHVHAFELLRSNGERLLCSRTENHELFRATIGGLGLTGLILWAEIPLKRIPGPRMEVESIPFSGLDEFFDLSAASDRESEYTVAWFDSLGRGGPVARGIFFRADHAASTEAGSAAESRSARWSVPFDFPEFVLNRGTAWLFNALYYRLNARREARRKLTDYRPFFFPLDGVRNWNRVYGKRGFLQYQCVIPNDRAENALGRILTDARSVGLASFLTVLKVFGDSRSPGLLSFPRPGVTLAMDFPYRGRRTLEILERFDAAVRETGGAVYPAKDARMAGESFRTYFERWREFSTYVDPRFSSSFWRRVAASAA